MGLVKKFTGLFKFKEAEPKQYTAQKLELIVLSALSACIDQDTDLAEMKSCINEVLDLTFSKKVQLLIYVQDDTGINLGANQEAQSFTAEFLRQESTTAQLIEGFKNELAKQNRYVGAAPLTPDEPNFLS